MDQLKQKICMLEQERDIAYQKVVELDTILQKLRKKIDICNLVGADMSEDLLASVNMEQYSAVPLTMDSPGVRGMSALDQYFLYICIDKDTWRRSPLVMWSK